MLRVDKLAVALGDFRLEDISFKVEKGAYFVLLGASGVGKSILLETLAGLVPSSAGTVHLDDTDITHEPIQDRGLGLVYQDQCLFPHLSVKQNIAYGLVARHRGRPEQDAEVQRIAKLAGVEELLERRPGTLSGGEAQRVALARALAVQPKCLLLDEPLSSLDTHGRSGLRRLLRRLHRDGQTIVHVTHDYEEAISLATEVAVMEKGRIVQQGAPGEVLRHPRSEFMARFVGIRNFFEGTLQPSGGASGSPAKFATRGLTFSILTDHGEGPGYLVLRSEDITLSASKPEGSAQNTFRGVVQDVEPAHLGIEVVVDIGVELAALVTESSLKGLGLAPGKEVWASFKASAGKFIEE